MPTDRVTSKWSNLDALRMILWEHPDALRELLAKYSPGDQDLSPPLLKLKKGYVSVRWGLSTRSGVRCSIIEKTHHGRLGGQAEREDRYLGYFGSVRPGFDGLRTLLAVNYAETIDGGHKIVRTRWRGLDTTQYAQLLRPPRNREVTDPKTGVKCQVHREYYCFTNNAAAVLAWVRGVLNAVRGFHDAGFVHCDLLARNIIIPCKVLNPNNLIVELDLEKPYIIDLEYCLSPTDRSKAAPFGGAIREDGWFYTDGKPMALNPQDRSIHLCAGVIEGPDDNEMTISKERKYKREIPGDESSSIVYHEKPFEKFPLIDWGADLFSLGMTLETMIADGDFVGDDNIKKYLYALPQRLRDYGAYPNAGKKTRNPSDTPPHEKLIREITFDLGVDTRIFSSFQVEVPAESYSSKGVLEHQPSVMAPGGATPDEHPDNKAAPAAPVNPNPASAGQTSPAKKSRGNAKAPRIPAAETLVKPPGSEEDMQAASANVVSRELAKQEEIAWKTDLENRLKKEREDLARLEAARKAEEEIRQKSRQEAQHKTPGIFSFLLFAALVFGVTGVATFLVVGAVKMYQDKQTSTASTASAPKPVAQADPAPSAPLPPPAFSAAEQIQTALRAIHYTFMGSSEWQSAVDQLAVLCGGASLAGNDGAACQDAWRSIQQSYLQRTGEIKKTNWWKEKDRLNTKPNPAMREWFAATRTLAKRGLWVARVDQAMGDTAGAMLKENPGPGTLASRTAAARDLAALISKSAPSRAQVAGVWVDTPPDVQRSLRIEGARQLWELAQIDREENSNYPFTSPSQARTIAPWNDLVSPAVQAVAGMERPSQQLQALMGYSEACWNGQPEKAKNWFKAASKANPDDPGNDTPVKYASEMFERLEKNSPVPCGRNTAK